MEPELDAMMASTENSADLGFLRRDGTAPSGASPVVFAADANYVMQLATVLRSLADACRRELPVQCIILHDGIRDDLRHQVYASVPPSRIALRWVEIDLSRFGAFATAAYISKMTYARLLLGDVLPASVKRAIYLDTDLLVFDDPRVLANADLGHAVLGAVIDTIDPLLRDGQSVCAEVPRVSSYFNAGVLLVDLDRWRTERVAERAAEFLAEHPTTLYMDQDALNVACDGRWARLDPRWNRQDHLRSRPSGPGDTHRPAIVHFVTRMKPWHAASLSTYAVLYDSYRRRTSFARTPLDVARDTLLWQWSRFKRSVRRYLPRDVPQARATGTLPARIR